jgi:pyruvate dehydrogenase E2 component (dihydrolipoamide acetyltransferase)
MELVARGDGVLRKRLVGEGESRPVGQLIAVIAPAEENIDALIAGASAPPAAAAAAPQSAAPAEAKQAEQVVATPEKAPTVAAPVAPAAAPPPPSAPPPAAPSAQVSAEGNGGQTRSSPLARRLASERGLDLSQVRGSGPGGRIIKRDIESAQAASTGAPQRPAAVAPAAGDYEDIALTQIRKTIAKRLVESIGPIPTFYLTAEFDLTRVTEMRAAMLEMGDEFKVSINDILMKAVATALAQHPEVNSHWLGDRIRRHHRVHLGMAVATDDGLIVPVIFDADRKRMSELSREARELAKRARERKLKPEEYTGSTFSISNLGMFGIDQFTAIINPPETAILAIGAAHDVAVPEGDGYVTRKRVRVTMSCDHRAVDGAVGAAFLQTLRRLIENPLMLDF